MCVYACGCAPQREAAALRLRTTATAVRLGTRAEGALHGERSYRCAKVVDERSMRDQLTIMSPAPKTRMADFFSVRNRFLARFPKSFLTKQILCSESSTSWGQPAHHFFSRAFSIVFGNVVPCPPSRAVSHK